MGWTNFLAKAAKTGLRVGANHITHGVSESIIDKFEGDDPVVDPEITEKLGPKAEVAVSIGDRLHSSLSSGIVMGKFVYDTKTLIELYRQSKENGLTLEEMSILFDHLSDLSDTLDEAL